MVANNHDHPIHRSINDLKLLEPREQRTAVDIFIDSNIETIPPTQANYSIES